MQLLYYLRKPMAESIYAPKLADSLHLALMDGETVLPLNHNSGVLFAKAVPDDQGVYHAYSIKDPCIIKADGLWHVVARRTEVDGTDTGVLLHFTSADLILYTEEILPLSSPLAEAWANRADCQADGKLPEGCIPCGVIEVDDGTVTRLKNRFLTPVNVANEVPAEIHACDLNKVRAAARYSDGSTVEKRVDWRLGGIDLTRPGRYEIQGRIHQDRYEFPLALHKADPAICRWQGKYYFISTNDLDGNHTLFIRESDTIPGLATAQQTCILDTKTYAHLGNLLWAPELHIIGGKLYCFHGGTPGPFVEEQSHVMVLREGGDPLVAADWSMSRRIEKRDGSLLYGKEGITLDQTVFWSAGRLYTSWSQRQFNPVDQGAWLMIAELDPEHPWRLLSDPQVLTVPEFGWENNHVFVVEGPFALYHGGKIHLTYSAALVDSTYCVGLMTLDDGADPLILSNWTKQNAPLLSSRSVEGEYGPGHNAYVTDEDGLVWNTYHARSGLQPTHQGSSSEVIEGSDIVFGPRSSGVRRVHFNVEGFPVLDMTEPLDLDPALSWVRTTLIVD